MNIVKKGLLKYKKYKGLYFLSIFSSIFALFLSTLIFGRFFKEIGVEANINIILSSGIASIIGGMPIYYVNYHNMKKDENKNIKSLILSHIITFIVFYIIMFFCLFFIIIDFRMDLQF